ncbi:MAG: DNA repair protein RecN [Isosphaeraceae bacterium]|nr:DNA repair protein RecN [Isosphaeraceae bacterium]
MLRELSVQNLALIEDARVELKPGYCAWTGETGAGKSLLLTALGLVLGEKAAADLIRKGRAEARAAAVFDLDDPALRVDVEEILGGPIEEDVLILTRRIAANGRSQAHANGLPVTVGTLRRLGERLIDVHGQHEGRALLNADCQRALLDAYGGLDAPLAAYREAREAHAALRRRRLELQAAAERRERERALLAFERDELAAADPRPGEYDELTREAHRLASVEELRATTKEGYALLYEADRSAQELLERVARRIEPLAESVPELAEAAATLERLADETREVAYTLRRVGDDSDDDPERLEEIEARLALYRRLAGRFRCSPDELAARREQIEVQLAAIEQDEADLLGLDGPLAEAWAALKTAAAELSAARRKVCKAFAKAVQAHFKDLSLAEARLTVEVESEPLGDDPTAAPPPEDGADRVEIVFAPNPGEPPRPLRKIASGGELSRVTLAIKTVLAEVDRVPTLVFDEIDTGVGGRLGAVLGRKLAELARHHQVICVTHLPQMASFAGHQWVIRKQIERGRTRTTIEPLEEDDRIEEIAAMIRGDSAAEGTRQEALAMLVEARAAR